MTLKDDRTLLERIDKYGKGLSEWEVDFVESCMKRLEDDEEPLTEKQRSVALRIEEQRVE